ncbi:MAG: D-glycerate dehydrogenase [Deltaproteobacteria bacterium]|nr:D-glycerate dehydrogenase [Deltaproteobacteria bacterium]
MRPRIFVTQPIPDKALSLLRRHGDVALNHDSARIMTRAELAAAVRECEYLFCLLHDTVDRDVIGANPDLRMIASMAIIPAGIDVAEATARRIPVTTIPPMVTEETADLAWGLLFAVARNIVAGDRTLRQGLFPGSQSMHLVGRGVYGKTLGIVGLGRIGEAMARRARGFDMRVLYTKRSRLDVGREQELGVEYVSLTELLHGSDFVSINAVSTPETRHLIGSAELQAMKHTACLINTARGPLVDEAALAAALREKVIAGAALDVYEHEPEVHPALKECDNAVLTPHLGSAVTETRERMALIVAENIIAVMGGRRPPNLYNPEIY